MSNSSNALVPTNPTDIMSTAKALAESGYFTDARSAAQAYVKVLAGAELGLPPFQAMNGIHIISGKPVMGAGLIASLIKRSGKYNYRVTEQTDLVCAIDFYEGAELIGNSTFTLEQAKKAGVKNLDKFAQNMLFARAISNGAKWHTPDVFGGPVYTDGEIEPVYTSPVVEGEVTVVDERPRNATPVGKKATAEQMKALQEWQNGIDTLPALASAYTEHFTALGALDWLPSTEKNGLFKGFVDIAFNKGFDWNKTDKVFYAAEPALTEAEEVA